MKPDMQSAGKLERIPFSSRSYGGYTQGQLDFFESSVTDFGHENVYDPMAGQSFSISKIAYNGGKLFLSDINPVLCLLAFLRSPQAIVKRRELYRWYMDQLAKTVKSPLGKFKPVYVEDWLSEENRDALKDYAEALNLRRNPFDEKSGFWEAPLRERFSAAIPILAARKITCFRSSDNRTWIKPGGLQREGNLRQFFDAAVEHWFAFAEEIASSYKHIGRGETFIRPLDATSQKFGSKLKFDVIVNSPPYANRLDYFQMWAPETVVGTAIWSGDMAGLKSLQLGSNKVRAIEYRNILLPPSANEALEEIKNDAESYASSSYYYPYFRNYAEGLVSSLRVMASQLRRNGRIVIFVRDTTRKDILFPTGRIVEEALRLEKFKVLNKQRKLIKNHIGLKRRSSAAGIYGLGQQEWWMSFERER